MTIKFNMARDINGFNGFGLIPPDTVYKTTLAISTEQSFTVPSNMGMGGNGISSKSQWIAIFTFDPGTSVWVSNYTTATLPSSSFAAGTSFLNPTAWLVQGGSTLSFISGEIAGLGVALYAFS